MLTLLLFKQKLSVLIIFLLLLIKQSFTISQNFSYESSLMNLYSSVSGKKDLFLSPGSM